MINNKFEVYKIKREIKRSGTHYMFTRAVANEYGEPSKDWENVGVLNGLYHEQNEHVSISMGDTTQTRTKKIPSILCLYDDAAFLNLSVGDKTSINGKIMNVTGVVNIQEWNMIADISLEVVDNVT